MKWSSTQNRQARDLLQKLKAKDFTSANFVALVRQKCLKLYDDICLSLKTNSNPFLKHSD